LNQWAPHSSCATLPSFLASSSDCWPIRIFARSWATRDTKPSCRAKAPSGRHWSSSSAISGPELMHEIPRALHSRLGGRLQGGPGRIARGRWRGYRGLLGAREWLYGRGLLKSRALPCRVVSIGNLTVGGTGKTPAVEVAVQTLVALGHRPAVVSRGYGRTTRG